MSDELVPDRTPILTLPPDEPEAVLTPDEEEFKRKREKAQRCKVIALHRMGHHPINANVSNFNQKSKLKVLELVRELFEQPDDDIIKEFNEVCLDVVFDERQDFTSYPVYSRPVKPKVMDLSNNIIDPSV
jgi:hypothetical protein